MNIFWIQAYHFRDFSLSTYLFLKTFTCIYIYIYIEILGKGVLNGKCPARGPRKMSEAIAD